MLNRKLSMLVFLLLLPALLFSDISLTEEEYQAIMTALTNSETELQQQATLITSSEKLQKVLSSIISGQEQNYEQQKIYLEQQRREQNSKKVRAFLYGAATACIGLYILDKTNPDT